MKRSPFSPTRADLLDPSDELHQGATPFERAQHYGSRRHSALWLRANVAAIQRATFHGLDPVANKAAISGIVLAVLDTTARPDAT